MQPKPKCEHDKMKTVIIIIIKEITIIVVIVRIIRIIIIIGCFSENGFENEVENEKRGKNF
jgi:hypothetical protein